MNNQKRILDGKLDSILSIEFTPIVVSNDVLGPGGYINICGYEPQTRIKITTDSGPIELKYQGIILADSIGHHIEVYRKTYLARSEENSTPINPQETKISETPEGFVEKTEDRNFLFDATLQRWYL